MSNFALAAKNGWIKELLTAPSSAGLDGADTADLAPAERLALAGLEAQYAGLRGMSAIRGDLEEHARENREQMSRMITTAASGFDATRLALHQTTAAIERNTAVLESSLQATTNAVRESGRQIADTVEGLRADFHLAMGELITLQQHARAASDQILESLQSPLETAARELRKRGERSYQNGWYTDACEDLKAAIEKNRYDYFAQRDLANLALYHGDELEMERPALEMAAAHFAAAARYAEPYDRAYAAECRLYEATAAALQQRWKEARATCDRAYELNPNMTETLYQRASLAALSGDAAAAAADLAAAIAADIRYWDRALEDGDFQATDEVQASIAALLQKVLEESRAECAASLEALRGLRPAPGAENSSEAAALADLLGREVDAALPSPRPYVEISRDCRSLAARAEELVCFRVLQGHGEGVDVGVTSVAFSPDGRLVASTGCDTTIKLWDVESGHCVQALRPDTAPATNRLARIDAAAFVSAERLVAYSSWDGALRTWNTARGLAESALLLETVPREGRQRAAPAACFSHDGSRLAAGTARNDVAIWRTGTGQRLWLLEGHGNQVQALAFSADGRLLASGDGLTRGDGADSEYTVRIWDAESGKLLHTLAPRTGPCLALAFSPDGSLLVSSCGRGDLRVWDVTTGQTAQAFPSPGAEVRCLLWPVHSDRLLHGAGVDFSLQLRNASSGALLQKLPGHTRDLYCLAISPDESTVASGSQDNMIRLYRRKLVRA